jgi:hypothetical protein
VGSSQDQTLPGFERIGLVRYWMNSNLVLSLPGSERANASITQDRIALRGMDACTGHASAWHRRIQHGKEIAVESGDRSYPGSEYYRAALCTWLKPARWA